MLSVVVIVLQVIAIVFIGSFGRSTSSTIVNGVYLSSSLGLLLAFTLMTSAYKRLSITSLVTLLLIVAISL